MGYKVSVLIRFDDECSVLSMDLLQFYYSRNNSIPFPAGCTGQ
jgi:hypothetical protein